MNFKPDEKDWMAYLYGELEGEEKAKMDLYLQENSEARVQMGELLSLRKALGSVEDKEVIAPPVFIEAGKQRFLWNAPHLKVIVSIAASLLLLLLVGKATDTRISFVGNEFRLSYGEPKVVPVPVDVEEQPILTPEDVQTMINASLAHNNSKVETALKKSQKDLDTSIRKNLAENSGKIDELMRQVVTASQDQIRQYVLTMQAQNTQVVKDYFQLSAQEQKTYIEDILVDFTQYMQQQRNNDLQLVQTQFNSLKQNTDVFQQETEQILTSIISSVGPNQPTSETKN